MIPRGANADGALKAGSPILFVALSLDVGGAERHLGAIMPELAARGWPVSIYCTNRLGAYAADVAGKGVAVLGPPFERSPGNQPLLKRFGATAAAAVSLFREMRRRRPRIVHFFLPEPYIFGAPSALMLGVPVRLMSRRGLNLYQSQWPGSAFVERRLHRHMNAVLGNSRRVVSDLVDGEGCDPRKVGLIYNGVGIAGLGTPQERGPIRQALGLPADGLVATIVANLIGYKGHADLLQGLAQVRTQMPEPWTLLCVGRDEGARGELEQMTRALGLASGVRFLGPRDDVPALLAASDIAILASHQEGFSNAIIEAMAAGLPLVVTDVGGNPEAVVHGETGFVVPAHDPGAMGRALRQLANDPALRAQFGGEGRRRAETLFTLTACVDRYEETYLGLLAGKSIADIPGVNILGDQPRS